MSDTGLIATFSQTAFVAADLVERKAGQTVSVCIPARDEERTVGQVVGVVRDGLVDRVGLVDEVVVVDDGSRDLTAVMAERAGATVVPSSDATDEGGASLGIGKGGAMRKGLASTSGDLVVFVDADVSSLRAQSVAGLLGPLLLDASVMLVKARYNPSDPGAAIGVGRVNELAARPVLGLLFPDLAGVEQPIAGETAVRRRALEGLQLDDGYAVEMGMLIDVTGRFGAASLVQVDIGVRIHRRRPLEQLIPQANDVLGAALRRAGMLAQR